jgi:tetratricopeptide (TPR) repeat protein
VGLCYWGVNRIRVIETSEQAFELSRSGFKTEALKLYTSLHQSPFVGGPTLFSHARLLYNTNRSSEAKVILAEAMQKYTENELFKLSAAIAYEEGNYKQAEKDYLTAIYMVPNRMKTRYELVNFYLATKDTANAICWCKSILQMPVKVPSVIAEDILRSTRKILKKIKPQ